MRPPFKICLPKLLGTSLLLILVFTFTHAQENIELKNQLAEELKAQGLAGAVWSIVKNGEIFTDSWGIKNMDEQSELGKIKQP